MKLVLRQEFPLGRFHATPWRVNPFDDPFGEWPPSPWRLVRAVTARWYQCARETEKERDLGALERLLAALCKSTFAYHLPADARKGTPLRQYHPTEFGMDPPNWRHVAQYQRATGGAPAASDSTESAAKKSKTKASRKKELTSEEKSNIEAKKKVTELKGVKIAESKIEGKQFVEWEVTVKDKGADETKSKIERILGTPSIPWQRVADAGTRGYGTSLVQDNFWCVAPESPVWWFIEGDDWTSDLCALFAQCVERMTYFGRAETLTRIRIATSADDVPPANCALVDKRSGGAVPVLSPLSNATREDIERTTDNPEAVKRDIPPGAQWLYAVRPPRSTSRERRRAPAYHRNCHLMQFAIGWNVAPNPRAIVRLTSRFRGAVLRELLRLKTGENSANWSRVSRDVREAVADMTGKDANGDALKGHRHTEFLAWCENGQPTRVLVWRDSRAFDAIEQEAILLASARNISLAAPGSDSDEWNVRLVPLDREVPSPPGFDARASMTWESVTPYVPPRFHLRGGKERGRETLSEQIRRELHLRGLVEPVEVEIVGTPTWVSVHVPRREANQRTFIGDRRARRVQLRFSSPVSGPIRLGHSSSFGLGLFRPTGE